MKQIPQNKSPSSVTGPRTTGDLVAGDLLAAMLPCGADDLVVGDSVAAPPLFVAQTIVFQSSAAL
jgi:hypothetical protein